MATYELHFMCWTFGNQSHDPLMITREVKQLLYNYMKFCQTMQEFGQVENAKVRKPKYGNGSTETEVRK